MFIKNLNNNFNLNILSYLQLIKLFIYYLCVIYKLFIYYLNVH